MGPVQWYYAHGDQQTGPVSSVRMKHLAGAGVLQPEDLVWREGMEDWTAARNVKGLFGGSLSKAAETFSPGIESGTMPPEIAPQPPPPPKMGSAAGHSRHVPVHLFDIILDFVRAQFPAQFLDSTARIFKLCGHYGLYVVMAACLALSLVVGVTSESPESIRVGLAAVLILAGLQYAAGRLWDAMDRLNRASSQRISSPIIPDCLALLCMAAGVMVLLSRALAATATKDYWLILSGLLAFVLYEYLAFVSLNLGALRVGVASDVRASDEVIGLFCFLTRAGLRLVPVAYGAGVVAGIIRLLHACYLVVGEQGAVDATMVSLPLGGVIRMQPSEAAAFETIRGTTFFAALPLLGYVAFLLCHLLIELMRGVLSIPSKLDKLAEREDD